VFREAKGGQNVVRAKLYNTLEEIRKSTSHCNAFKYTATRRNTATKTNMYQKEEERYR